MVRVSRHEAAQSLDGVEAGASSGSDVRDEVLVVQSQLAELSFGKSVIRDEHRDVIQ